MLFKYLYYLSLLVKNFDIFVKFFIWKLITYISIVVNVNEININDKDL